MQPLVFVLKPKDVWWRGRTQAGYLKRHLKFSLIRHAPLLASILAGTLNIQSGKREQAQFEEIAFAGYCLRWLLSMCQAPVNVP
jgi:hypothetical protein